MIMPRRTRLLRLFLLLCATLLFLYSYSPRFSNPNFDPNTLNLSQNSNLIPSNFTLIIKVLAFDRIDSLSRCLKSLAESDYERDRVDLHIFIDHFKILDSKNTELDKKLEESHRILKFVDEFSWNFGEKFMHYRTANEGLQAQWLEAWWPSSDGEFAFVVEDDLELSPLYYKFLKRLILNYYYNPSNFNPSIYGASLQRPRFVSGKHGNKLHVDNQTHLFLYQIVGTWGQLLFPKPWKEFRIWYDIHKAKGIKPILQGMVTTGWYKKMGEKIWTPWFIKFIHSRGYYNIYTNLLHERSLSISHRDAGVNYGKTVGPDSYLLRKDNLDFNLWEMQPLNNLKWFDFCFQEIHPGRLVKSFDNFEHVFSYLHKQKSVILVSLFRSSDTITKNLLCHFERLNIRNYIFIGAPQELQLDLARRGHSVIDVGQLRNEINWQKFYNSGETHKEYIEEIILKAYILKEFLRLGFNTMVIDGNVVPLSNLFSDLFDSSYDISIAKEIDLLFVSQSPLIVKSWDDKFIYSLISLGLPFHTHFGDLVARSLEGKNLKINRFDEQNFSDARENGVHVNRTQIDAGKKLIYWSFDMDWKFVQARLEAQGLWMIDNDSSCIAVICHQSDSNF